MWSPEREPEQNIWGYFIETRSKQSCYLFSFFFKPNGCQHMFLLVSVNFTFWFCLSTSVSTRFLFPRTLWLTGDMTQRCRLCAPHGFWGFQMCLEWKSCWFQINFRLSSQKTPETRWFPPPKKKHTLTVARPDSAETVFNQRDILGEPGERNPAFAVDYLSCASKTENCGKREEERTLDCSFVTYLQNKTTAEEKGCFFLHIQREKMDLFIWLCGCLLAFLLPSAVKTEEGGKFDTFAARSNHSVTRRC